MSAVCAILGIGNAFLFRVLHNFGIVAWAIYLFIGIMFAAMVALYGKYFERRSNDEILITSVAACILWPSFIIGALIESCFFGGK